MNATASLLSRLAAGLTRSSIATRRARVRLGSLEAWGRKYVPHFFGLPSSKQHVWLSGKLGSLGERNLTRLCIIGPRDSAKSTWVSFLFPLCCICEGRERYITLFSEASDQARQYLEAIKEELTTNPRIEADYPEVFGEGEVWRQNAIVTRNGIRVEALGAGKRIRGKKQRQERPSLVIVDDPEGEEATFSATRRARIRSWFLRAVLKLGSPRTVFLVAGTKLHRECLVAKLPEMPGWASREFRSIEEYPARMDLWAQWEEILRDRQREDREDVARAFFLEHEEEMEKGASVLWPERLSLYALMKERAEDRVSFEQERQNSPVDPSACEWPETYFDYAGFWFQEWPRDAALTVKTIALDPSKGKDARKGDYAAQVKLGRDTKGFLYVEAELVRRPTDQLCEMLIEAQGAFKADGVAIETNNFQELLATEIARLSRERGIMVPIHELENKVNKNVRIRRLGPYLSRRVFRFKSRSPGTQLLVDQLKDFPVGEHDDGGDSLEMALRLAIQLYNGKAIDNQPVFQFNNA